MIICDLRCERQAEPCGVAVRQPRLSWRIEDTGHPARRGLKQTAWRVRVASTPERLAAGAPDLWDSGWIASGQSQHVPYAGQPLTSRMTCYWTVEVETTCGRAAGAPAVWTMGLLDPGDWHAAWIRMPAAMTDAASEAGEFPVSPSPWLRGRVECATPPDRAIVYVESRGYHELWVNGNKADESVLGPAVSVLKRRSFYIAYDVTAWLKTGTNLLGVWLGNGWNAIGTPGIRDPRPMVRVQLECGTATMKPIAWSDAGWTCAISPYSTVSKWDWNLFGGERYDARLDQPDWCRDGSGDAGWVPVEVAESPGAQTTFQRTPLNRIGQILPAQTCVRHAEGHYEVDFGTDLTGWMRITFPRLAEGQRVIMRYADSGGGEYNQFDEFLSAGGATETFVSKFNYHGFRRVVIVGLDEAPPLTGIAALLIESDLPQAGRFACSNELFNRIHAMNVWTLRCLDLGGYLVDCPHRERLGYGDGQVTTEPTLMNFDAETFLAKWLQDWVDTEGPEPGRLPFSTPYHFPGGEDHFGREGPPGWGGALVVLGWHHFVYYGDPEVLRHLYEPMTRFLARLDSRCDAGILRGHGDHYQHLGDWLPPGRGADVPERWPTQEMNECFNSCYYIYLLGLMEQIADALDRKEDAAIHRRRAETLRPLVHQAFYNPEEGLYVIDEQAYQVMPLMAGVVPESLRDAVFQKLEQGIMQRCDGHLDTGMLGTLFLFKYLSDVGRDDLIFTMTNQETYPSWGYMLAQGATTIWEQWDGFWSRIHSCFTGPDRWFYQSVGGIRPDETVPGFRRAVIRPAVVDQLAWAECAHTTAYGEIRCRWEHTAEGFRLDLHVPPNSSAIVYIPATGEEDLLESGNPAARAEGVLSLLLQAGMARVEVDAGTYRFYKPKSPNDA